MAFIYAAANFERQGVPAGFVLSPGGSLAVQITKGVLFAQGLMYRPADAPALPEAPAGAMSWLHYNSVTGFYWHGSPSPLESDDAFLGWAVTSATAVIYVSSQQITVADASGGSSGSSVGGSQGGVAAQGAGASLVEWLEAATLKSTRNRANFLNNVTVTDNVAQERADLALVPGGAFAPFTALWEWNESSITDWTTRSLGEFGSAQMLEDASTTITDTVQPANDHMHIPFIRCRSPLGEFGETKVTGYHYINTPFAPEPGYWLVIICDHAASSGAGLVWLASEPTQYGVENWDTPLRDQYLVKLETNIELIKYITQTKYTQGAPTNGGGIAVNPYWPMRRIIWAINSDGACRVWMPGNSPSFIYKVPMTFSVAQRLTAGYVGLKTWGNPQGDISVSMLGIYLVPNAGLNQLCM